MTEEQWVAHLATMYGLFVSVHASCDWCQKPNLALERFCSKPCEEHQKKKERADD